MPDTATMLVSKAADQQLTELAVAVLVDRLRRLSESDREIFCYLIRTDPARAAKMILPKE